MLGAAPGLPTFHARTKTSRSSRAIAQADRSFGVPCRQTFFPGRPDKRSTAKPVRIVMMPKKKRGGRDAGLFEFLVKDPKWFLGAGSLDRNSGPSPGRFSWVPCCHTIRQKHRRTTKAREV